MFHEFAVDPEALKTWPAFRYLTDQFGMSQGRLISKFPGKWKRAVYQACSETSPVDKARIEVGLGRIEPKLYTAGRASDNGLDWISNAVASHAADPFRAIITTAQRCGPIGTLDHDEITEETEAWIPGIDPVLRQSIAMAKAAEKLLKCSREIVFVDQHYSCAGRHLRPLQAFIRCALQGPHPIRMEYHLGSNGTADWFREALGRQAPRLGLPNGLPLSLYRWKETDQGEELHPRYILTELGGIRFEVGLDDADDRESRQTTDVSALDQPTYSRRWNEYRPDSTTFNLEDAWIIVNGSVTRRPLP